MRLGRNQCGCDCRNKTDWAPGEGLPHGSCSQCETVEVPCEWIAIFDRCAKNCDGLRISSNGVVSLLKDDCLAEDSCRYTARRYKDLETGDCSAGNLFLSFLSGVFDVGLDGVCNGPFTQWWPSIQDGAYNTPIFGCGLGSSGGAGGVMRCGWYDLYEQIACAEGLEGMTEEDRILNGDYVSYIQWLENCTEVMWELEYADGGIATLTGTTDSGYSLEYTIANAPNGGAEDPPGEPVFLCGERNTMRLITYPDPTCPNLPEYVCVVPGGTQFRTPCTDKEDVVECCDPGMDELVFTLASDDCASVDGMEICTGRYVNGSNIGVTSSTQHNAFRPTGACGFFYGFKTYSVNGGDQTLALIAWCEEGDWKYTLICGDTALCEEEDLTRTECCPYPQFAAIDCTGLDAISPCCDDDGTVVIDCCGDDYPVNTTLFATLSAASCAILNGVVITLTYAGGASWTGTFSTVRCGDMTFYFDVTPDCNIYMYIKNSGGTIIWGSDSASCNTLACPLVSEACTFAIPGCQVEAVIPPLCTGNLTATVTP